MTASICPSCKISYSSPFILNIVPFPNVLIIVSPIFNALKYLLVISFFLSAFQGGAIVMAVKDLGKLFVLFGVLIVLDSLKDSKSYGK
jgi:hypothetical protein